MQNIPFSVSKTNQNVIFRIQFFFQYLTYGKYFQSEFNAL